MFEIYLNDLFFNTFQPKAHIYAPYASYVILRHYLPTAMDIPFQPEHFFQFLKILYPSG